MDWKTLKRHIRKTALTKIEQCEIGEYSNLLGVGYTKLRDGYYAVGDVKRPNASGYLHGELRSCANMLVKEVEDRLVKETKGMSDAQFAAHLDQIAAQLEAA